MVNGELGSRKGMNFSRDLLGFPAVAPPTGGSARSPELGIDFVAASLPGTGGIWSRCAGWWMSAGEARVIAKIESRRMKTLAPSWKPPMG